jgi:hypothetical protein
MAMCMINEARACSSYWLSALSKTPFRVSCHSPVLVSGPMDLAGYRGPQTQRSELCSV